MATLAERFWSKVAMGESDECWLWTGAVNPDTHYAVIWRDKRFVLAHRVSYELAHGVIPDGLMIDHVKARGCKYRHCVNPRHLEPVTNKVNVLRGDGITARNARKTHCPQGHPFEGDNLYVTSEGKRQCLTCKRLSSRERMRRRRAKARGEEVGHDG